MLQYRGCNFPNKALHGGVRRSGGDVNYGLSARDVFNFRACLALLADHARENGGIVRGVAD